MAMGFHEAILGGDGFFPVFLPGGGFVKVADRRISEEKEGKDG
jgi:hypothetical protein